jgi:hypothetical protein
VPPVVVPPVVGGGGNGPSFENGGFVPVDHCANVVSPALMRWVSRVLPLINVKTLTPSVS